MTQDALGSRHLRLRGVLIDSELMSVRADRECLAECGIELTEAELLERYTGISWAGMVADLVTRHGPLPADLDELHLKLKMDGLI